MTASLLFANNASSRLFAAIDAVTTSIRVQAGDGDKFPQPPGDGSMVFAVTLEDRRSGQIEICTCYGRSFDILNVTRGQEGTAAQAFALGATVSNRVTAATMGFLAQAGNIYIGDNPPTSADHGQLWWESDSGTLYIRYDDGNSSQWVEVAGTGGSGMSETPDGLYPEYFDTTGALESGGDAGPAIRAMFAAGAAGGINVYRFKAGRTYNLKSPDPLDPGHTLAVYLKNVTKDIFVHAHGATIKGFQTIQQDPLVASTMLRVEGDDAHRFVWHGGKFELIGMTPATGGVMTVGGMSLASLHTELHGVWFDHGTTAASGDAIGVGGGDQSVFVTSWASLLVDGCTFIGAPDLGLYLSSSGGQGARIVNNRFYRCNNAIAQKRQSRESIISNNRFIECDLGIYNPVVTVTEPVNNNHGGPFYITNNTFKNIQTSPIDIGGSTADGSRVENNTFLGWGRRISDGGELTVAGQRFAVRIRVPRCIVSGNLFDNTKTLTTTAGKEQIGIEFNYSGGVVATGAEDCQSYGNTFRNVLRAHNFGANTFRNRRYKNKRVGVSLYDADAGDNVLPIRMLDDTMQVILTPQGRSILTVKSTISGPGWPNGILYINTTGGPLAPVGNLLPPTNIVFATGITTVAGAVDGSFTFSTMLGELYLINRIAGTVILNLQWDEE